jgi:DNA-binding NtrC family response regulator
MATRDQLMHRVLIVDDDVSLTEMIREFLALEGFDVDLFTMARPACRPNSLARILSYSTSCFRRSPALRF